jgi:hypothetical protein
MKYHQVIEWMLENGFENMTWVFEHFNTSPGYDREVFSKEFEIEEAREIGTCSNCGRSEVYLRIRFRKPNDPTYTDAMHLIGCTSKERGCACEHITDSDIEQFKQDFAKEAAEASTSVLNYITSPEFKLSLIKYRVVMRHYKLFKELFNEKSATIAISNNKIRININNSYMFNTQINIKH